jgi:hypothetical protein
VVLMGDLFVVEKICCLSFCVKDDSVPSLLSVVGMTVVVVVDLSIAGDGVVVVVVGEVVVVDGTVVVGKVEAVVGVAVVVGGGPVVVVEEVVVVDATVVVVGTGALETSVMTGEVLGSTTETADVGKDETGNT